MDLPAWLSAVVHIVLVVAVAVFIFCSPLYLFISSAYVRLAYAQPGFPPAERFVPAERQRLSDAIMDYLFGRVSRAELAAVPTDRGEVALREAEVQHLVDVKGVMDGFWWAHRISTALGLVGVWIVWRTQRAALPGYLRQSVWLVGAVILLIVVASFVDFEVFFTRFHEVFFAAESWLFYETDTLIQLYPLPFWSQIVWRIGMAILVELGLVYGVAALVERGTRGAGA